MATVFPLTRTISKRRTCSDRRASNFPLSAVFPSSCKLFASAERFHPDVRAPCRRPLSSRQAASYVQAEGDFWPACEKFASGRCLLDDGEHICKRPTCSFAPQFSPEYLPPAAVLPFTFTTIRHRQPAALARAPGTRTPVEISRIHTSATAGSTYARTSRLTTFLLLHGIQAFTRTPRTRMPARVQSTSALATPSCCVTVSTRGRTDGWTCVGSLAPPSSILLYRKAI